jgi:MFS family permease
MYQGEISTAETRGAMMCVTGVAYAFGYTLAGWLGFACFFFPADSPNATFAWRFPLAVQCLPPIVVLAGSGYIPFSPRWLLSKGRREEAFDVVKRLHRTPDDKEDIAARQEFYLMEKQYEMDAQFVMRPFEIFRTAPNRRRSLIAAIMMWGDQFLGIFVLTNYGVLIYASLGLQGFRPLLLNACWTTFTIIGNIWTALYIDRWGRRTFLLIGATGVTVSLVFLCALTAKYLNTTNTAGLNAAVFFIWFFILWWCFFVDATQYVYVSEIWPNHLRSQGTAWGLAFFYLASEITLVAAPVALNSIGRRFYLVLIVPSVCYIAAIWFLFPVSIAVPTRHLVASIDSDIGDQRTDFGGDWVFVWR